jgi:hypothetical protein
MKAAISLAALLAAVLLVSGCVSDGTTGDITGAVTGAPSGGSADFGWETVSVLSGGGNFMEMTGSVRVSEGTWRYTWSCSGEGLISVYAYQVGSKLVRSDAVSQPCPGSGSRVVQEGNNEYYFKVRLEGADSWSIRVEE